MSNNFLIAFSDSPRPHHPVPEHIRQYKLNGFDQNGDMDSGSNMDSYW